MITNHRMGLKIWRIQRIKIPGITESKRKPLDYKARQRVGLKFYYFKPSIFFEKSLKFFAHINSCYDFDLSDVSQKSQS